jgi:hypothetical protein
MWGEYCGECIKKKVWWKNETKTFPVKDYRVSDEGVVIFEDEEIEGE